MEHFFTCPYCGEEISMILELKGGEQSYVEDCEVCCNPIEVKFRTDGESVTDFRAQRLN